jgi:hypothetical protein
MEYITRSSILHSPNGRKIYEEFSKAFAPRYESGGPKKKIVAYAMDEYRAFLLAHPNLVKDDRMRCETKNSPIDVHEEIGLLRGQVHDLALKVDLLLAKMNEVLSNLPSNDMR